MKKTNILIEMCIRDRDIPSVKTDMTVFDGEVVYDNL